MNSDPRKDALRLAVIFLGRKRPGFDPAWGEAMAKKVRACLKKTGFQVFEPKEKVIDDPSLRAALADCEREGADVILTLHTTMADGRLAPTLAQLWRDPIVLWATPENQAGEMISSCSLVGVHTWAGSLRQLNHPFEIVYGDPEDAALLDRLKQAARLARTARKVRLARVGVIGGQAPGFFAMSVDPFAVQRGVGAQAQFFSLVEFADVVEGFSEEEVARDIAAFKALGIRHKDTTDEDLPMASRLYLAMRHYMENEGVDALSVRCWPEMPGKFGQWPYVGLARLAEEGRAVACEGDGDGALAALIGESLGMGRCALSDWLEHDAQTITLWHGGAAPMSLAPALGKPGGPRLALHFNNKKPAVIESTLRPGMPVTVFRLWRLEGRYLMTACEGETIKPRRRLMGTNGLARMEGRDPREWFEDLCHAGMPHHVIVAQGAHAALLKRFARLMNIQWID